MEYRNMQTDYTDLWLGKEVDAEEGIYIFIWQAWLLWGFFFPQEEVGDLFTVDSF